MHDITNKYNLTIIPNTLASFGGGEHLAFDMAKKLGNMYDIRIVNPISSKDLVRVKKSKLLKEQGIDEKLVCDVECRGVNMKAFGTEDFILMIPTKKGKHKLEEIAKWSDSIYCITNNPFLVEYTVKMCKKYGTKFVFAIQNRIFASYFEKSKRIGDRIGTVFYRRILKKIEYFHALNSFDARLVKRYLPKAKVYMIPGFTSLSKPKIKTNKRKFVALWVGRLPRYQKGVDLLCDVIKHTSEREKGVEFKIVGGGGDGESLVRRISKLYKDTVKWLGFLPYDSVKEQYTDSDLLIFTARGDELRYFPLVFLEGQTYGLPIVSFNGNSYNEIIDRSVGKLVNSFNTKTFSDYVISYYELWRSDKRKYLRMKNKISDTTMKVYGEDVIVPKMASMLKK